MTISMTILDKAVDAYSIAEAKAHLSALIELVAHGKTVTLTKRGRPVARIVPADSTSPKPKLDLAALQKFRDTLPASPIDAAQMVRRMRDERDGW